MDKTISEQRLRSSIEVVVFVALTFGSKLLLDPFAWKFSGPLSLLISLTVLTFYLRRRGEGWSDLGFVKFSRLWSWLLVVPQALLAMAGIIGIGAAVYFVGAYFGVEALNQRPESVDARWGDVKGNIGIYLMWLGVVWTSAAFGEEMFFRGFLIDRCAKIFVGVRFAPFLAILLPALIFGIGHMYYQGIRGLLMTGLVGLWLGALYLGYKRNIWPLVLAHGLVDSLAFTAEFLDLDI